MIFECFLGEVFICQKRKVEFAGNKVTAIAVYLRKKITENVAALMSDPSMRSLSSNNT